MAQAFAKSFYNSSAWKKCRESFIKERIATDGGLCTICHDYSGFIVHHIEKLTPKNINDPNITLNHSNLMFVCHRCHDAIHFADMHGINYSFDENGQPLPINF